MSSILDDPQLVLFRKRIQLIQIDHQSTDVNRDDANDINLFALQTAVSRRFQLLRRVLEIDVLGDWIAVDQDRNRTLVEHDLGGGSKGHRGHKDALATLQVQGFDGEMQRRGTRVDGYRMASPHTLRKLRLELLDARSCCQPATAQAFANVCNRRFRDRGSKEGDVQFSFHGIATSLLVRHLSRQHRL